MKPCRHVFPRKRHAEMEHKPLSPAGNYRAEPTSCRAAEPWGRASDCHRNPPYRTAESEGAQYPFQQDINRKRCLITSKTSRLLFFFNFAFQTEPD